MRIRKHHSRGNAGEESSSGANPDLGSQEQADLVMSSRGVKEKPEEEFLNNAEVMREGRPDEGSVAGLASVGIERVDSSSRSQFTWLDKLRHSKGFTEIEPYSNLEEFVSFLTKKDEGVSSSRKEAHRKVMEESCHDMTRLVGSIDLNAPETLARYSSACSDLSSKQASVGTLSPALISGDESSISVPLAQGIETVGFIKEAEDLGVPLAKDEKQKGEMQHSRRKPSNYWKQASNTAGTSSEKPTLNELKRPGTAKEVPCTSISPQPASGEAVFEQHHVNPGYDKSSIAEASEFRHGTVPPREENQDTSTEITQRRSRRNRRISSFTGYLPQATATSLENHPSLSPDHPSQQRRESLIFSVYTVCLRAGRAGLTPREVISEIRDQGLAGLEGGAAQSVKHIANLLRNSPYYMELGEGKFALCSSVIDVEQDIVDQESPIERDSLPSSKSKETEFSTEDELQNSTGSEDNVPKTGRKRKRAVIGASQPETEVKVRPGRIGRPKKLKYIKQENAETLGNQCNRNDGKGWVCPLLAKPGYQLCDHHLDKLRCKPGSRSKTKKSKKMSDEVDVTQMREELHLVDTAGHETSTPLDVSTGLEDAENFSS